MDEYARRGMAKTLRQLMPPALQPFARWGIILVFALPIALSLGQILLASFGYFPSLNAREFTLQIWQDALSTPGLAKALSITFVTGLSATALALVLSFSLTAFLEEKAPKIALIILSTPHVAIATGLAFLIAPSGWITRILGFDLPPQIESSHTSAALILGLALKETPFLIVMILSAKAQTQINTFLTQARSLCVHPQTAWLKIAIPLLYPLIRMPVLVVLSFSISVVDMSLILGPTAPPALPVLILRFYSAPDLQSLLPASALSILLILATATAFLLWLGLTALLKYLTQNWIANGAAKSAFNPLMRTISFISIALFFLGGVALFSMLIWSFAWRWPFPDILPQRWSLAFWRDWPLWINPLWQSLSLGAMSAILSLCLAILWLESTPKSRGYWIYIPLILPQISLLFGLNMISLFAGLRYGFAFTLFAHCLYVLPYILIALSDAWHALDPRFLNIAASLHQSPWQRLWRVKLPMLLRPILMATAIGFSVSLALYLPTLFMGAGRIETLTTKAVTLSSSGDRRLIGLFALWQILLPLLGFAFATLIPKYRFRNRKAMQHA